MFEVAFLNHSLSLSLSFSVVGGVCGGGGWVGGVGGWIVCVCHTALLHIERHLMRDC